MCTSTLHSASTHILNIHVSYGMLNYSHSTNSTHILCCTVKTSKQENNEQSEIERKNQQQQQQTAPTKNSTNAEKPCNTAADGGKKNREREREGESCSIAHSKRRRIIITIIIAHIMENNNFVFRIKYVWI